MKIHKKTNKDEIDVVEIKGKNNSRIFMSYETYENQQNKKKSSSLLLLIFLILGFAMFVYIAIFFL